jgi:predicted nucleic acid-binding protein
MKRYRNLPMSLADASLVRMSELTSDCQIVTFDRDFTVYRRHDRRSIPLLIPDAD